MFSLRFILLTVDIYSVYSCTCHLWPCISTEREQVPLESDLNDLFWMSNWTQSRSLFQWLYWADFLTGLAQVEIDFQWGGVHWKEYGERNIPLAIAASGLKLFLSLSPFPSILFHSSPFLVTYHSLGLLIFNIQIHPWNSQTNVLPTSQNNFTTHTRDQTFHCLGAFSTPPVPSGITSLPQGEEKDMTKPMISKSNYQLLVLAENSSNWNMQE